jgi:hypothetical protein
VSEPILILGADSVVLATVAKPLRFGDLRSTLDRVLTARRRAAPA